MLEDILAKSEPRESLWEHTQNVIQRWEAVRNRYEAMLDVDEEFWIRSFVSVLYHDFGKISDNFQNNIHPDKYCKAEDRIRHEFISGVYLFLCDHPFYSRNPESLMAVFSHHKKLNRDIFSPSTQPQLSINEAMLIEAGNLFSKELKVLFDFTLPNRAEVETQIHLVDYDSLYIDCFWKHFLNPFLETEDLNPLVRIRYIYFKAILNISDWLASAHEQLSEGVSFNEITLQSSIVNKLASKEKLGITEKFQWRKFQINSRINGNVICIAPTGSGKTEAALIWASQKKAHERIIYLLPTRVTSNAIFQRLQSYFGKDEIAVVHSSALFYRKEVDGEEYKEYLRDKTFFKNINVCTVDQILTQGFNVGYWELKTFHMMNSWVVIDEIHLYAPYTLGLIIATLTYLQDYFGTRFFIMSATMPSKLLTLLQKTLEVPTLIRDDQLLDQARNVFETRDCEAAGCIEEIMYDLNQGKKVLWVVNTVDQAIEFYQKLEKECNEKNIPIYCYHSRFILKDRQQREKEIFEQEKCDESCLLIATQVVEVSLDIDFDMLYTENAPIDAIIQRAGRVNRKRKKEHTKVVVFKHSDKAENLYKPNQILYDTFLQLSQLHGKALTELKLSQLVDQIYKDLDIEAQKEYQEALNKYQEIQKEFNFILDVEVAEDLFTTRKIEIVKISVIPERYHEDLIKASFHEKRKYEVPIAAWVRKKFGTNSDSQGFEYIDLPYCSKVGLEIPKNTKNREDHSTYAF